MGNLVDYVVGVEDYFVVVFWKVVGFFDCCEGKIDVWK